VTLSMPSSDMIAMMKDGEKKGEQRRAQRRAQGKDRDSQPDNK